MAGKRRFSLLLALLAVPLLPAAMASGDDAFLFADPQAGPGQDDDPQGACTLAHGDLDESNDGGEPVVSTGGDVLAVSATESGEWQVDSCTLEGCPTVIPEFPFVRPQCACDLVWEAYYIILEIVTDLTVLPEERAESAFTCPSAAPTAAPQAAA